MAAISQHSCRIIITTSIFFSMIATTAAFFTPVVEDTITVSADAVSPEMQPLLLLYYSRRTENRFSLALPKLSEDSVIVSADEESELWLLCSPLNAPAGLENMLVKNETPQSGWQLSHIKCANKVTASVQDTGFRCSSQHATATQHKVGFWVLVGTYDDESSSQKIEPKKKSKAESSQQIEPKKKNKAPLIKISEKLKDSGLFLFSRSSGSKKGKSSKSDSQGTGMQNMYTEFVSLYDSCYDLNQNMPTRTEITVYGTAFDAKARLDSIPVLPDGEWDYDDTEVVNVYEKDRQFAAFSAILGANAATNFNDRSIRFLLKLQLISATNMIFYAWRATLFTYVNIAGMYESVLGMGWRKMDETVELHIYRARQDFMIITGQWGIIQLGEKNMSIFLQFSSSHSPKMGVPYIFWKLVQNLFTGKVIVFIAINNPHASECALSSSCNGRCSELNSPLAAYDKPWTGCMMCCSYFEAAALIPELPQFQYVHPQVLSFNN